MQVEGLAGGAGRGSGPECSACILGSGWKAKVMMRKHVLLLVAVVAVLVTLGGVVLCAKDGGKPETVMGACGHAGVKFVNAQLRDIAQSCAALRDVLSYFGGIGLAFEPIVTIEFGAASSDEGGGWFRSHGSFDAHGLTIRLKDSAGFLAWGISTPGVLGPSFLNHELVHSAVHLILGEQVSRVPRHWQEFIAYAVQFELMTSPLRDAILAANRDISAFDDVAYVNEFIYASAPEAFAISAYKMYVAKGRGEFLRQILTFEIKLPPPLYPPSPLLPSQVTPR